MRISIDGRGIENEHQIEVFRFFALFRALITLEPEWQWFLCVTKDGKEKIMQLAPELTKYCFVLPWGGGLFGREVQLVSALKDLQANLYHFYTPDIPYMFVGKSLVSLTSLSEFLAPNPLLAESIEIKFQNYRLERTLRKVSRVLVDSQVLFQQLQEYPDFRSQDCRILPSVQLFAKNHPRKEIKRYRKTDSAYIYISMGMQYSSNIHCVLAALELVGQNFRCELYISGEEDSHSLEIRKSILEGGLQDRVHIIGPVTLKEHESLLVHATAYVNVAYSEVYFAPLLDAASLDTPIVTGHNLADFAQISPHEYHTCSQIDPESIAQAIIDAYTNPKRLSAASQEALRNRHAPDIVARQLLEMYQELG